MSKKLNADQITNDLEGSAFFQSAKHPRSSTSAEPAQAIDTEPKPSTKRQSQQVANQSADQSVDQSTSQSTEAATSASVSRSNKIVDRPKAFYITERLDRRLDEAVRYFQHTHGLRKVDRSTLINALLDDDSLWTDNSLDHLVDQLISQLTSRLTGR